MGINDREDEKVFVSFINRQSSIQGLNDYIQFHVVPREVEGFYVQYGTGYLVLINNQW